MSNKTFCVLRNTYLNGVNIESNRLMGVRQSRENADAACESYQDMVVKNIAVKGFSFTFHISEFEGEGDE